MSLTKLTTNLNIHQSLPDQPSMSTEELKKEWDKAPNAIKQYINEVLTRELDTLIAQKIDKISGKGLSTNDFTDAEKIKLANIDENKQYNITSGTEEPSGGSSGDIYIQYFE